MPQGADPPFFHRFLPYTCLSLQRKDLPEILGNDVREKFHFEYLQLQRVHYLIGLERGERGRTLK